MAVTKRQDHAAPHTPGDVTELLLRWSDGDASALDELMPLVYDELRRLARSRLRRERPNHTLQPTELVNDVYLKLVNQKKVTWQCRAQFFGLTSRIMRNILVDHALRHRPRTQNSSLSLADSSCEKRTVDIVAVHELLEELEKFARRQAQIAEMKFFGGMTIEEIAEALKLSHATVERDWTTARAWLLSRLQ